MRPTTRIGKWRLLPLARLVPAKDRWFFVVTVLCMLLAAVAAPEPAHETSHTGAHPQATPLDRARHLIDLGLNGHASIDSCGSEPTDETRTTIELDTILSDVSRDATRRLEGLKTLDEGARARLEAELGSPDFFPGALARRQVEREAQWDQLIEPALVSARELRDRIVDHARTYVSPFTADRWARRLSEVSHGKDPRTNRWLTVMSLRDVMGRVLDERRDYLEEEWESLPAVAAVYKKLLEKSNELFHQLDALERFQGVAVTDEQRASIQRNRDGIYYRLVANSTQRRELSLFQQSPPPEGVKRLLKEQRQRDWLESRRRELSESSRLRALVSEVPDVSEAAIEQFLPAFPLPYLHGRFLTKHAERAPVVFSLLFTTDPKTGLPVLHSAAVLEGKPKPGKTGNVQVLFYPDAEELDRRSSFSRKLHLEAAAKRLESPEISKSKRLHCKDAVLKETTDA